MSNEHPYSIVVGVDGSESSKAALRWAVRHASVVRGRLTAVMAWDYPLGYSDEVPAYIREEFPTTAATSLSRTVTEVVGEEGALEVQQEVAQGHPARALLHVAEEARADLIVVGNRGHGGFTGALLGSIGQYVVHHARCPVVVIREASQQATATRS